jgi:hypothetical protein
MLKHIPPTPNPPKGVVAKADFPQLLEFILKITKMAKRNTPTNGAIFLKTLPLSTKTPPTGKTYHKEY